MAALDWSAGQIEQGILLREVLAPLTRDEQRVCLWKFMELSSQEIARRRGTTGTAVDMLFFHAKQSAYSTHRDQPIHSIVITWSGAS